MTLHLGLPKTATTTLQRTFFPNIEGIHYLGKDYLGKEGGDAGPNSASMHERLASVFMQYLTGQEFEGELKDWVRDLAAMGYEEVLLSDESLSEWRSPLSKKSSSWITGHDQSIDIPRTGEHPTTHFLRLLAERLPKDSTLQVILGIRNQTDYLASLSAESGVDFSGVVSRVLASNDASLDFYAMYRDFSLVVGASNFLLLIFEDGLAQNTQKILAFLNRDSFSGRGHLEHLNARKAGEDAWISVPAAPAGLQNLLAILRISYANRRRMKNLGEKILPEFLIRRILRPRVVTVTQAERSQIQDRFRVSNQNLADALNKNLSGLGY